MFFRTLNAAAAERSSTPVCDCVCLQASKMILFYGVLLDGYSVLGVK